jgi:hypothetical protein
MLLLACPRETYLTSLEPRQPVVDFEYHAFSINPIRIPDLKPSHARSTLWLAKVILLGRFRKGRSRRSGRERRRR